MTAPPLIRLGSSCCNLVKYSSTNLLRCKFSVRSLAYTTCSNVSDSSSDTSHPREKLGGKFNYVINEALEEQLKRERTSTLLSMRQLKESGFKHDLETYMSVVRLLSHWDWGMDAVSDNLLNDVIDNTNWEVVSFHISDDLLEAMMEEKLIKAVEGLVEVYASAGRFEEAIHTLSEMKIRSGLMVSTRTCNNVLYELIKLDKDDKIESVYRELKRIGLIPSNFTYAILMRGICSKGCLKDVWKVIEEMEEAGVEPSAVINKTYIYGLCSKGKTDLAFQLVKFLRESNKPVDVFAYACVIRGFVKESKLQDAEDVFLDMKLRQVVPDERCYTILIIGYCKKGDTDKALDLFKEMESRGIVPDAFCYNTLIIGYCQKGDIDKALDLFKEMESRGIETDHVFVRRMMKYLSDLGMLDETLCLFKHFTQQSRVVFLDGVSFNIAIDAARKLGKMDDAMGFVEEMKARKIKPVVIQARGLEPTTGFQGQWVQRNVGQDEGVQSEGVHNGVVQDARDQAAVGYVGQLHTTQPTLALHKLTSLSAHHAVILKKFRKSERQPKMKIRKAVYDIDGGGSSMDKPVQLDEA